MRNEGARIQNRLELVYYRFVRFSSSRILDEQLQKRQSAEAYFLREGLIFIQIALAHYDVTYCIMNFRTNFKILGFRASKS
jgi:hypothetical protein